MIIEVYIPPMSGGFSVVPVDGSNKQLYDADTQEHVPDFRLTPASFKIAGWKVEGVTGSEVTTFVDLTIHEFKDNKWTEVTSTNGITIDYTAGLISIARNNDPGMTREFRADFKVSNSARPGMPLVESQPFDVVCVIEASSSFRLVPGYPQGRGAHVMKRLPSYGLACPVFKGNEEWFQAYYRWYRVIDNVKTEITGDTASGITGYDSSEIRVPFGELNERGNSYECVVDPVTDLVGVNLISKAMISDDWNAIKAGTSISGEDADGKYFRVNETNLYIAFGSETKDIFGGKIKYKSNQRYKFMVSAKSLALSSGGYPGLIFRFKYTDGTTESVSISRSLTTKTTLQLTTASNKQLDRIVSTFGADQGSLIYDIQFVEYFGESNLVTGGAYARIPVSGVATGNNFNSFYINEGVATQLTQGTKVTLSIEDVNFLAGNSNDLTVQLFNGTFLDQFSISSTKKKITRIFNNFASNEMSPRLRIYAGILGNNVVGNAVELRGVMLVIGENAYKYSPADGEFIPALADGAPKPALPGNALSEMMVLNKVYPAQVNKRDMLVEKSNNLNGGNAFVASCKLDTASGTIEKPELSYSCLWKSRDNSGVWSDLGKGFTITGAFDKKLEIVSSYEKGLDNAKWVANFNGIDQYLYNDNPSSIYPWGGSTERIHVIEFIVNEITSYMQAVVSMCVTASGETFGFALAIANDGRLQYRAGKQSGATSAPTVYYGTTIIQPGKLYRVEVTIAVNGTYTAKVNGVPETFKGVGGALYAGNHVRIGLSSSDMYLNGKVLRYIVRNSDKSVYAEWDFQPTGGRANMLKRKKADGGVETTNKSDLLAKNIPNIDDIDPENGFFVTI